MMEEYTRIIILVLVFASVLLGVEAITSAVRQRRSGKSAINKRLSMIARYGHQVAFKRMLRSVERYSYLPAPLSNWMASFSTLTMSSGLRADPLTVLSYAGAAAFAVFIVGLVLASQLTSSLTFNVVFLIATFAAALGLLLPFAYLSRRSDQRKKRLEEQFPTALDIFVRSLRAGHPAMAGLKIVTAELPDPIGSEFGIALDEVTYGADLRDALQAMASRCDSEDMQMFVVCLSIQAETGGNLAEILSNLAQVIRERASMMMKVRALSSEGRMTGQILTGLPLITFVVLFAVNPAFYIEVASDPLFVPCFGGLILAFFTGVFWIRRLVDLRV